MTVDEYRLKYPIGTAIIYTPDINIVDYDAAKDTGKKGIIVGYTDKKVKIYLPTSNYQSRFQPKLTWICRWEHISPAIVKYEQLLFSFMNE